MFKRIVVANDGSEGGYRALAVACDLARIHRARLSMTAWCGSRRVRCWS
jgi:nucleotide-binding universal stress UspA family protein